MFASLVGRLDPATGEMREFKLPENARPHSILNDAAGKIWYTGNGNGTVGRLDPRTGDIKVYPMPDPAARDPHTPIFDKKGQLWFTLQQSNMVGRLIRLRARSSWSPCRRPARPYGIVINSQGVLWVAATDPTGSRASIRRRWKCGSIRRRRRRHGSAGWT